MTEVEKFGMYNLGENFQRFCDAWTGAIEVLIAIGHEDASGSHRG